MVIPSSAHFQVCDCGKHGRVILVSGRLGPESPDKETAMRSADFAIERGWVKPEEAGELRRQIKDSQLPESVEDADPGTLVKIGIINFARRIALLSEVHETGDSEPLFGTNDPTIKH